MVRAKKHLGQHFLKDKNIAKKIVQSLEATGINNVIEIGPGTGILTEYLLNREFETYVVEIDEESVDFLKKHFSMPEDRIINQDFLKLNIRSIVNEQLAIIGNFPYNISSQILFKVLENREIIPELVGTFQKEVAERIASKPGSKKYGILSVLIQAFYDTDYLFTLNESVFLPPPKVKSGVIRLTRKKDYKLICDEPLFFRLVKAGFNQRRKMLRNSLKDIYKDMQTDNAFFSKRPEQLSVEDFVSLTKMIEEKAS
ncbi:MAG: 16S rRNA (adenine(1518)-N(6)/adenine(1519)-N(6))-dimethyltransferase RsmA [Bacteroidales bacterium]|nr:16S rRNA (adenine(1518)-N(6)/adenine(1519)-N(6))-dimethyltransferase RsmA [Bacteroidales bacterium]